MKYLLSIILLFLIQVSIFAQSAHELRLEADKLYDDGNQKEAEILYRKALDKEEEYKANYNLGNTLYNQERYEEASEAYIKASEETKNKSVLNKIYYNLGNSRYKEKKIKESIEAYKEALRQNPDDEDARKNLYLVKQIQKEQQQKKQNKEQQKNQNKQNKNQQKQDQKQDNNKDKKEQQNQDQKDKEQQPKEQKEDSKDTEGRQAQPQKMTQEEMEKLLKAIGNDDKEIQKKVRLMKSKSKKRKKDW